MLSGSLPRLRSGFGKRSRLRSGLRSGVRSECALACARGYIWISAWACARAFFLRLYALGLALGLAPRLALGLAPRPALSIRKALEVVLRVALGLAAGLAAGSATATVLNILIFSRDKTHAASTAPGPSRCEVRMVLSEFVPVRCLGKVQHALVSRSVRASHTCSVHSAGVVFTSRRFFPHP